MWLLLKYLKYVLTARHQKGHGIHSPFLYQLIRSVFRDRYYYQAYQQIETYFSGIKARSHFIEKNHYGAGSRKSSTRIQAERSLLHSSGVPQKYGRLLFRMVRYLQPANVIELGTSLGVSTCYMAMAIPEAPLYTIEGCVNCFQRANDHFQALNLHHIKPIRGTFYDQLLRLIQEMEQIDFVFIDGHHIRHSTITYLDLILKKSHKDTVVVIDDIHWSKDMTQAWKEIRHHPAVVLSVDLFRMGILFFSKGLTAGHFVIRY